MDATIGCLRRRDPRRRLPVALIHRTCRIALLGALGPVMLLEQGARAAVRLPAILSDNMVLQQGRPLVIRGWADVGEGITLEVAGQSKTGMTGDANSWSVTLDPLPAGGPYDLKVTGRNVVEVHNILAGEVWLGSGQSNMEQALAGWDFKGDGVRTAPVNDSVREIATANFPAIRMLTVKKRQAE
ncbi:MAG: hypothetical protein NTW21_00750 [Verrucomicrobia bacterium]|nr:hypothetical protein [Verrucomicrobiota bacterium]